MKFLCKVLMIALICSCATKLPKSNFNLKKVDYKTSGVFFGKVSIIHDDNLLAGDSCSLSFVDSSNQKQVVSVDKKGHFMGEAADGDVYLQRITCLKAGYFNFSKDLITFKNVKGSKHNYVGDLKVKWNSGDYNAGLTAAALLIGWVAVSTTSPKLLIRNSDRFERSVASNNKFLKSFIKIPLEWKLPKEDKFTN